MGGSGGGRVKRKLEGCGNGGLSGKRGMGIRKVRWGTEGGESGECGSHFSFFF